MSSRRQAATPTTSYDQYEDPDQPWPYEPVPRNPYEDPDAVMWKGNKEYAFVAEDGSVYQGRYCRALVENAGAVDQPVFLGFDQKDDEVPIIHRELFRGVFIGGQPGTGKTTIGSNILLQLALSGYGWVFMDPGGEEYYRLLQRAPETLKDRLVPINPQADWRGRTIKLNYIETFHSPGEPGYKAEVENKVSNILPMLQAEYPLMKGVAENMLRALIKSHKQDDEYDYCLIDFYHALDNKDEYAHLVEEQRLTFLRSYANRIRDELEESDLEPLLRRLKKWIESDLIRPLLCSRDSDISIADAVDRDLCLIINCDIGNDEARQAVMTAFSRAVWSVIFSRKSTMEREIMELEGVTAPTVGGDPDHDTDLFKPFFFAADEWHALDSEDTNMGEVLAMARKKRLGVIALTQQLRQLGEGARGAFKRNTAAKLAFNPGDDDDERRVLAKAFDGKGQDELNALDRFHAITAVVDKEGQSTPALNAHMLPEYPFRRSLKEANAWINDTLDEYGSPIQSDEEILSEGRFSPGSPATTGEGEGEGVDLTPERKHALLEAVFAAAVDEQAEAVSTDAVRDRLRARLDAETADVHLDALVQQANSRGLVDVAPTGGEITLAPDGREELLSTGTSGNAGGISHQAPAEHVARGVNELGYVTEIPMQDGDEKPDFVGHVPVETGGETAAEALEALETLEADYPSLYALAGECPLAVEYEKSTSETKPAQLGANLAWAVRNDYHALLVVPQGEDAFSGRAETIVKKLSDPILVYNRPPADVDRRFHHGGLLSIGDGIRVALPAEETPQWVDDDGSIVLRASSGREYARFASVDAWRARSRDDFATTYRQSDDGVTVRDNGEIHTYTDEDAFADDYARVYEPFIPEVEFAETGLPDADEWDIAVLPDDADLPLQYYDRSRGECYPLVDLADYRGSESGDESDDWW